MSYFKKSHQHKPKKGKGSYDRLMSQDISPEERREIMDELPQVVSHVINPLNGYAEWAVYDRQRPYGSGMCVTTGKTIDEAEENYRKYRDYDGIFIVNIGSPDVPDLQEGVSLRDLNLPKAEDEQCTHVNTTTVGGATPPKG